ncbi:MAG: hypothetical protein GY801_40830 [bacterium]|nr:hypothetical protein [bacterium]
MKKFLQVSSLMLLCLIVMAVSASAMTQYYGYANGVSGCNSYSGNGYNSNNGRGYGCGAVAPNRYPGSTEYCTKWIAGHWVQVRVMVPGRWVYRPVWIRSYPVSQNKWVPGFWQTTGTNVRPDLHIWGSPNAGWYGRPYQGQTGGNTGGYFGPNGVWISNQR